MMRATKNRLVFSLLGDGGPHVSFLMVNRDDVKQMTEEDDKYWFEVVRKGGETEYFPEPGKELRWRYQYNGLDAIMKEKLEWVESQS